MSDAVKSIVDFSQLISERYNQLTKSEKRIADYLRKNQEESAFLSAGEVASRLGLSEATLVRFARTLGFGSYPAMRSVLQEAFRRRVTHSARLRGRLDDLREGGDILERLVVSEIDYLTQALITVDRQELHRAVALMCARKRVFIFGVGPSVALVDLMETRLRRFGRQVIPITTVGREFLEPLLLMTDQDLLFIISFFDTSPAHQLVMNYARDVGCPAILLTDVLGSLLREKVDVVLSAKRGPVAEFHSLVVPMAVIETLLLALANEEQDRVMEHLDKLDRLRDRLKQNNGKHA